MKEVAGAAERVGMVAAEMERVAEGMAVEAVPPGSAVVVKAEAAMVVARRQSRLAQMLPSQLATSGHCQMACSLG